MKFRLQSLLNLRLSDRDARRTEFAQAIQASEILDVEMNATRQQLDDTIRHAREASAPGPLDVDALLNWHRYELILQMQLQQLQQRAAQVAEEVERRRQRLVEADREVKILEKLRDKRETEFITAQNHLEQKQIDEIAQSKSTRLVRL